MDSSDRPVRDGAALYKRGVDMIEGNGVERDVERGVHWLKEASHLGSADAQYYIGQMYLDGVWTVEMEEQAEARRRAKREGVEYENIPSLVSEEKDTHLQNTEQAIKWLLRASERGHAGAAYCLGRRIYGDPDSPYCDRRRAANQYIRAAKSGHAESQYQAGVCYYTGDGVRRNLAQAMCMWANAAAAGYKLAEIMLRQMEEHAVSIMEETSETAKEKVERIRFEQMVDRAMEGDAQAQRRLADYYRTGGTFGVISIEPDDEMSAYWDSKVNSH